MIRDCEFPGVWNAVVQGGVNCSKIEYKRLGYQSCRYLAKCLGFDLEIGLNPSPVIDLSSIVCMEFGNQGIRNGANTTVLITM